MAGCQSCADVTSLEDAVVVSIEKEEMPEEGDLPGLLVGPGQTIFRTGDHSWC